ncbi:TetR/AcrR family transcriptional regulator [Actinomadura rupiterrae]|uniref:TetR/AcrR family transcriptional regulator n=1 Tax=Actinomadura rupiterrae TaxID=559627 RepID=UPI0020A3A54D|nr:TetR/AcrR family transcriptional regulator [Actinomadura rupiterrae]MCP2337227.1 AcrR family transcriptional regulator [Actinomadura rupiterrae]
MSPRTAAAVRDGGRSLREHLVAAAARLIAERGTADLTVRAIARSAGVADGVLYNHFADKDELLAEAWEAHVQAIEDGLPPLPRPGEGTLADGVRAQLTHGLALHRAVMPGLSGLLGRPELLARLTAPRPSGTDWRDRLRAWLLAEQDLGRIPPNAPVDASAALIVGVCHESVLTTLLQATQTTAPPSPDHLNALTQAILHGLT